MHPKIQFIMPSIENHFFWGGGGIEIGSATF